MRFVARDSSGAQPKAWTPVPPTQNGWKPAGQRRRKEHKERAPWLGHPFFPFTRRRKECLHYIRIDNDFGKGDHIVDLVGRN
jgi:hypothetical protein